jgi:hypothetical protein
VRFYFGYADENQPQHRLLLGGDDGIDYAANTGTLDITADVAGNFRTGSYDMGIPQTLKEFGNVLIDVDPQDATITVTPYINAEATALTPTVISGAGRRKVPISLSDTYAYSIAFDFSWSGPATFYQIEILFRVDEEALKHWEMPETSHGIAGWMHVRDAYFCLRSTAPVTFTHTIDGVEKEYVLAATGGERRRIYVRMAPQLGKVFRYALDSDEDFRLYGEDSQLNVKSWNDTGYKALFPFVAPGYAPFLRKEAGT